MALVTRLDELVAQFGELAESRSIEHAIREAYRIGHDDGRHARIPQGEETFADRLKRQQEESSGQEP